MTGDRQRKKLDRLIAVYAKLQQTWDEDEEESTTEQKAAWKASLSDEIQAEQTVPNEFRMETESEDEMCLIAKKKYAAGRNEVRGEEL